MFGFQKLDVYQCMKVFLPLAFTVAKRVGGGQGDLPDQLRRAALSMNLNLAEGCGRLGRDQKRFFTTARGSALECAAILDAVETMALLERGEVVRGMQLLVRIVAMLTKMIA